MTVEDPDMKPIPGVFKPAGTSNYHYQKKVPKDLLLHPSINGKTWGFRGSLDTGDLKEAHKRAVKKLAALNDHWDTLRASQKVTPPGAGIPGPG